MEDNMEFTLENVKDYKDEHWDNELICYCCDYIINNWDEDIEGHVEDICIHSCMDGSVSEFLYNKDCEEFYDKYRAEISDALYNTGCSAKEIFGDYWDNTDPLAAYSTNKTILARFGFSETIEHIVRDLGLDF